MSGLVFWPLLLQTVVEEKCGERVEKKRISELSLRSNESVEGVVRRSGEGVVALCLQFAENPLLVSDYSDDNTDDDVIHFDLRFGAQNKRPIERQIAEKSSFASNRFQNKRIAFSHNFRHQKVFHSKTVEEMLFSDLRRKEGEVFEKRAEEVVASGGRQRVSGQMAPKRSSKTFQSLFGFKTKTKIE